MTTTTTFATIVTLGALVLIVGMKANGEPVEMNEPIPGITLKVIQAAIPEFEERGLKLEQYVVSVIEQESSYVVVFDDRNRPPSLRGSTPDLVAFEVEVDKQGLRPIRANFVR
jgi:hypothetical protein